MQGSQAALRYWLERHCRRHDSDNWFSPRVAFSCSCVVARMTMAIRTDPNQKLTTGRVLRGHCQRRSRTGKSVGGATAVVAATAVAAGAGSQGADDRHGAARLHRAAQCHTRPALTEVFFGHYIHFKSGPLLSSCEVISPPMMHERCTPRGNIHQRAAPHLAKRAESHVHLLCAQISVHALEKPDVWKETDAFLNACGTLCSGHGCLARCEVDAWHAHSYLQPYKLSTNSEAPGYGPAARPPTKSSGCDACGSHGRAAALMRPPRPAGSGVGCAGGAASHPPEVRCSSACRARRWAWWKLTRAACCALDSPPHPALLAALFGACRRATHVENFLRLDTNISAAEHYIIQPFFCTMWRSMCSLVNPGLRARNGRASA